MSKKVLVGLSWGVDSAVTAYLLQQQWYEVDAGFMKNYVSDDPNCPTKVDSEVAVKVAKFLWLKNFKVFDFQEEYYSKVVEYIFEGYKKGITPNPDIMCNSEIKFKLFQEKAIQEWYDYIATGHYANIEEDNQWYFWLKKWLDPNKDQSYFLSWLNQEQLSKTLFPIGGFYKSQVREIAQQINLPNADRKDSQWICFIGKVDMHKFLEEKLPVQEWDIVDTNWNFIKKHKGAWFYTIGQRRWLDIWEVANIRYFVVDKDIQNNKIIVGTKEDLNLYSDHLTTSDLHWLTKPYNLPFKWTAKIRHQQPDKNVTIEKLDENSIKAIFDEQIRAVASWQTIAIYDWDYLIWSWTIS